MNPTHFERDETTERDLFFIAAPEIADIPPAFTFPSQNFAALLVTDSTRIADEALATFSTSFVRAGCSYFCSWGPDCERAHDIFERQCLDIDPVIMTTWHADEPLDEAIWFFLRTTFPDDAYFDTTRTGLAVVVGAPDWASHVERRLRDIPSLAHDVLQ